MGNKLRSKRNPKQGPEQKRKFRLPIKEELRHCLIFGFKARIPIAIVLSYVDYQE